MNNLPTHSLPPPGAGIFFSGICGVSMSAIAQALARMGYKVWGSDIDDGPVAARLRDEGIGVCIGHAAANAHGAQMLVYNARIKEDNPERQYAVRNGIHVIPRAAMLGLLMDRYQTAIGVTGCHGKSTTTTMISHIFLRAGLDPTFFIGAPYPPLNSSHRLGGDKYFIYEADEYADSFLNFRSDIAVVLNVEMDHPDYFRDLEHMLRSYRAHLEGCNPGCVAVINIDDPNAASLCGVGGHECVRVGTAAGADVRMENLISERGKFSFDVICGGMRYARIKLAVPGKFNAHNALCAAAVAWRCGIGGDAAAAAMATFTGAGRRFEFKGTLNGADVIDDYGHHPTEVASTLKSAAGMGYGKVWCVFQPHTYSRLRDLWDDFTKSLSLADKLIITDVYTASERDTLGVSSAALAAAIPGAAYIPDFGDIAARLRAEVRPGELVIVMGAGDVVRLTPLLVRGG